MKVELRTSNEALKDMERFAALAALTCHGNINKPYDPQEVLERIIKKGHESVLEHINLTYSIKGLSRACLQELARHRHICLSVESTRHTLRKSIEEPDSVAHISDYVLPQFREGLLTFLAFAYSHSDMSNDELKYALPEFWPTNLIMTTNVRELRHILKLRTAPEALKEFQVLARSMYNCVPDGFKYLLQDCVHKEAGNA